MYLLMKIKCSALNIVKDIERGAILSVKFVKKQGNLVSEDIVNVNVWSTVDVEKCENEW